MTFEMDWSHSFCLACDRQTEGNVYCSESCRLADYEDASSPSSYNLSPSSQSTFSWSGKSHSSSTTTLKSNNSHTDISSFHRNSSASSLYNSNSDVPTTSTSTKSSKTTANPLSSCSSTYSTREARVYPGSETAQLSEDTRRALRMYANSFDQSRYCRRKSGY